MLLHSDLQLEFEVVGAGGKDTYIAVDDIFISSHPCESEGLWPPCHKLLRLKSSIHQTIRAALTLCLLL